jgi:hypothetical protein
MLKKDEEELDKRRKEVAEKAGRMQRHACRSTRDSIF